MRATRGYRRLREMADEIAWQNYNQLIGCGVKSTDYYKGQIAGLESLFQNLNNTIEEFKEYIEDIEKTMVDGGDSNGD